MHIEPGLVDGAKLALGYATGAGALAYTGKLAWQAVRDRGAMFLAAGTVITASLTFVFFELLPHFSVGVSEVHFVLGSTLFLLFGAAPAALGLALGLLIQGLALAPTDLPQYGMNVTTLLVPLFVISALTDRIVPATTRYVDMKYSQVLTLSVAFQGGVVAWVAFWVFHGQGFTAETMASVGVFGAAYMVVVVVEPLADLAVLALAKMTRGAGPALARMLEPRLYQTG